MQVLKSVFDAFSSYNNLVAGLLLSGAAHFAIYLGISGSNIRGSEQLVDSRFHIIEIQVSGNKPGNPETVKEPAETPETKVKEVSKSEKIIKLKQLQKLNKTARKSSEENPVRGLAENSGLAIEGGERGILKPTYPLRSRIEGEEGQVIYEIKVGEGGRVEVATLLDSSGFKRLDNAAKDALLSSVLDTPEKSRKVTFTFKLEDSK